MTEIRSNPVMEVDVTTPVGFQPEFVEDETTEEVVDDAVETAEEQTQVEEEEQSEESTRSSGNLYVQEPDYEEDDVEEEAEEEDTRSKAAILAESFKEIGGLPEDFEITNDLTGYDLLVTLDKAREQAAAEKVRSEFSEKYGEDLLQYADYLRRGGDPNLISGTSALLSLDIDSDSDQAIENRKTLILSMYEDQGLKPKHAQRLYEDFFDEGEDLINAKEAQKYFHEKQSKEMAAAQAREEQMQREQQRRQEEMNNQIRKTIKQRKIGDIELTPQQADSLEKYMFEPTEVMEVNSGGQMRQARVSKYYKDYSEFFNSTENLIKLARFIQTGGKATVEEEEVERRINQKLVDKLNNPERGTGKRTKKSRKNAWIYPQDRPVAEFDL